MKPAAKGGGVGGGGVLKVTVVRPQQVSDPASIQ